MKSEACYSRRGFTLVELLIVISLLIFLLMVLLAGLGVQIGRAHDNRRKTDLSLLSKAFENYYNDNQCYPSDAVMASCGGTQMAPYWAKVPCDPVSKQPYLYSVGNAGTCSGYHICARLEDLHDPDIKRLGCDPDTGCGWGVGYNYCIVVGIQPFSQLTPTPTVTPVPIGSYACAPGGSCNLYANPAGAGCPVTFAVGNCNNACGNVANRCLY